MSDKKETLSITIELDAESIKENMQSSYDHEGDGEEGLSLSESIMDDVRYSIVERISKDQLKKLEESVYRKMQEKSEDLAIKAAISAMDRWGNETVVVDGVEVNRAKHAFNKNMDEALTKKVLDKNGNIAEGYNRREERYSVYEWFCKGHMEQYVIDKTRASMKEHKENTDIAIAQQVSNGFAQFMTKFLLENQGGILLANSIPGGKKDES